MRTGITTAAGSSDEMIELNGGKMIHIFINIGRFVSKILVKEAK